MGPGLSFLLLAFRHAGIISAPHFNMPAKNDVASSSAAGVSGKNTSGQTYLEKPTDKLNLRKFCEHFYIPNSVSIQLVDGEAMSVEKAADNAIYFTNEQFNTGSGFLFRISSKNSFTSLRFLRPTSIPI